MSSDDQLVVEGCFAANGLSLDPVLGSFSARVERPVANARDKGFTSEQWHALNQSTNGPGGYPIYVEHEDLTHPKQAVVVGWVNRLYEHEGYLCMSGMLFKQNPGADRVYSMLEQRKAGMSITYANDAPDQNGQHNYKRLMNVSFTTDPLRPYAQVITAQSNAMAAQPTPSDAAAPMNVDAPAPQTPAPVPTSAAPTPAKPTTTAPTAAPTKLSFTMPKTTEERAELLREKFERANQADQFEQELERQKTAYEAAQAELAQYREQASKAKQAEDARRLEEGMKHYAPALQQATSFDPENPEHKALLADKVLNDELLNSLFTPLVVHTNQLQQELEEKNQELEILKAHFGNGTAKKRAAPVDPAKNSASKSLAAESSTTAAPTPAAAPRTSMFVSRAEALKRANANQPATAPVPEAKPEEKKPSASAPTSFQPKMSYDYSGVRQFPDGGTLAGGKNGRQLAITAQSAKMSREESLNGQMQVECMGALREGSQFTKTLLADLGARLTKPTSQFNINDLEISDKRFANYSLVDAFVLNKSDETAALRPRALTLTKRDE